MVIERFLNNEFSGQRDEKIVFNGQTRFGTLQINDIWAKLTKLSGIQLAKFDFFICYEKR